MILPHTKGGWVSALAGGSFLAPPEQTAVHGLENSHILIDVDIRAYSLMKQQPLICGQQDMGNGLRVQVRVNLPSLLPSADDFTKMIDDGGANPKRDLSDLWITYCLSPKLDVEAYLGLRFRLREHSKEDIHILIKDLQGASVFFGIRN